MDTTPIDPSASIKSVAIGINSDYQDTNDMGQDQEDHEELLELRKKVIELQIQLDKAQQDKLKIYQNRRLAISRSLVNEGNVKAETVRLAGEPLPADFLSKYRANVHNIMNETEEKMVLESNNDDARQELVYDMLGKVSHESLKNMYRQSKHGERTDETNTLSNDEAIDNYLEMMEKREIVQDKSFGRHHNLDTFIKPEDSEPKALGNIKSLPMTEKDEFSFEKDSVNSMKNKGNFKIIELASS